MTKEEKQKIIEDMVKVIRKGEKKCVYIDTCEECKYYKKKHCGFVMLAEYLYRAGYRKVQKEKKK